MDRRAANLNALIACGERRDRETISAALTGRGAAAVRAVEDPGEAGELLGDGTVNLLVVDLGLDSPEIRQTLEDHASRPGSLLLGIVPAGSDWEWKRLPEVVDDFVSSPVDAGEFVARLDRLLAHAMSPPELRDEVEEELLFHGVDEEYVVSHPKTGEILEVNRRFVERSGEPESVWVGRSIDALGLVEIPELTEQRLAQLKRDGEVHYQCDRRTSDNGTEHVEVAQRMGMRHGRLVYLTRIRSRPMEDGAESSPSGMVERAFRVLSSIFGVAESESLTADLDRLLDCLVLDYLFVAVAGQNRNVKVLVSHGRGRPIDLSDKDAHAPYEKLLDGEELTSADRASEILGAGDPLIRKAGVKGYLGLPILATDGHVVGVIVAASKAPITGLDDIVAVLRMLARHFANRIEIRKLRVRSETRGLHDALTGLPNRMLFNDRLDHALKEAQRNGEMVALMFVDLDRFKTINDSLGHAIGDKVLLGVTQRLKASIRKSDTVARYAGDEFTVVMRHINHKDDVLRTARKLNRFLAEPIKVESDQELQITASIGVSFFPDDGQTAEELLKHADMAMYGAKGMGRNTTQSFVDEPEESHEQKLMLESKLRHAQENEELRVYYQPQVSAETEDIVGMEALIRWEHPELGLISPGFFIPLAEETGLIVPIGEWLLRQALKDTAEWHERFGLALSIGVNLSPLQLKQTDLVDVIEDALNQAELEPKYLDLEVTESISIKSIPGLKERLEACRELGCKVSIDDFGTGQASLDYLKRFPADRIKIDQSFVRNISVDPDDEAIVKATIDMAHSLKMSVLAEGVEEEKHLEFLQANGCEELQGYLFCRPLPPDSFARLLVEREELNVDRSRSEDSVSST